MTTTPADPAPALPTPLRVASAVFAGSMFLAVSDVLATAIGVPRPVAGLSLRLAYYVVAVAQTLGLGALLGLACAAFVHFTRAPARVGIAVAAALILPSAWFVLSENVQRGVQLLLPEVLWRVGFWTYFVGISVLIPLACMTAAEQARTLKLRALCVGIAVAVLTYDQFPLYDDYQGVHGVVACGAALFGGGAISDIVARGVLRLRARREGRAALATFAIFGLAGVFIPPSNAVRYELFRQPCAIAPWVLATVLWRAPALPTPAPEVPASPWFHDRSTDPPVPPGEHASVPKDAVIVLITVDAMRADDVFNPANAAIFPTFTRLGQEGITFTNTAAAGTQTPLSLATLFSGRTYSETFWSDFGDGAIRFGYPAADTSTRFPEVLTAHQVETFNMAGLIFLQNSFGVLRGFREEKVAVTGARHAMAPELIDPLLNKLRHWGRGPAFLYTHLTEPHEPYDRGRRDGTKHENYVSEIAIADQHIGRVLAVLKQRFPKRWALFVSSDHGEAFGEHHTHEHAKSLYEELLHVPFFAASPYFVPRKVETPVSLVDLGPTILDLFGQETPAAFLGESLTPILLGGSRDFTRPLFAEGRLRREMRFPDGLKIIEDLRRKFVEVYDLPNDPGELHNVFGTDPRSGLALATLRAFFAAHTRTANGYVPPFKP